MVSPDGLAACTYFALVRGCPGRNSGTKATFNQRPLQYKRGATAADPYISRHREAPLMKLLVFWGVVKTDSPFPQIPRAWVVRMPVS